MLLFFAVIYAAALLRAIFRYFYHARLFRCYELPPLLPLAAAIIFSDFRHADAFERLYYTLMLQRCARDSVRRWTMAPARYDAVAPVPQRLLRAPLPLKSAAAIAADDATDGLFAAELMPMMPLSLSPLSCR